MNFRHYVLNKDHTVRPVSLMEWAAFFESKDRIVAKTHFDPDIMVSTIFLGLDHRFEGNGPPLLFETIVFGINAKDEAFTWRYSTWDDAVTGHAATVRKVKDLLKKAGRPKLKVKSEREDC